MREIKIFKKQRLSDAFKVAGYPMLPSNAIIDKTLPGLGATYMELSTELSPRHSIIIEPNVPVIIDKQKDRSDVLAVWEKCTAKQVKKYLENDNIKYKKILTTPEGYNKKVRDVAIEVLGEKEFYSKYFCLFDECEKITQDVDYRKTISQPINDFLKFKNKAFISATPLDFRHPTINNEFVKYKVIPQYNYKKDINLICTTNFDFEVSRKLKELSSSKCVCVFINSTDSINKIINSNPCVKADYKVFCAKDSAKKLKDVGFSETEEFIRMPLAKYNFFTSRFFSAVDIELDFKPDVLILTNIFDAKHSMIDPFTESIQIYGRFRDTYLDRGELTFKSLTHIYNYDLLLTRKTNTEIDEEIEEFETTYKGLTHRLNDNALNLTRKNAITEELNNTLYAQLLDENGDVNYFSVGNLYNLERVKSYYQTPEALKDAYEMTEHFNVNFINNTVCIVGKDQASRVKKKKTFKDKCKEVIPLLDAIYLSSDEHILKSGKKTLAEIDDTKLIIDTYDLMGKQFLYDNDLSKTKIKRVIFSIQCKMKMLDDVVLRNIQAEFIIGKQYNTIEIQDKFKKIFYINGIDMKAKGTTLGYYFLFGTSNGKHVPRVFHIDWVKFNLPELLKERIINESIIL